MFLEVTSGVTGKKLLTNIDNLVSVHQVGKSAASIVRAGYPSLEVKESYEDLRTALSRQVGVVETSPPGQS